MDRHFFAAMLALAVAGYGFVRADWASMAAGVTIMAVATFFFMRSSRKRWQRAIWLNSTRGSRPCESLISGFHAPESIAINPDRARSVRITCWACGAGTIFWPDLEKPAHWKHANWPEFTRAAQALLAAHERDARGMATLIHPWLPGFQVHNQDQENDHA